MGNSEKNRQRKCDISLYPLKLRTESSQALASPKQRSDETVCALAINKQKLSSSTDRYTSEELQTDKDA